MIERAQSAVKKYRTDPGGFTKRITITKADGSFSAYVYGMHSKINMLTQTLDNAVHSKQAYVSIAEDALNDVGYPVRNSDGEVSLMNDLIMVADSTGTQCKYKIREVIPDETLGLLVCFLIDSE